jgi:hypothetical protein
METQAGMGRTPNTRRSGPSDAASSPRKSNRHSLPKNSAESRVSGGASVLLALVAAVGLSVYFWPKLWTGGGLIGGDTYTYYFPQKVTYQEALRGGRLPLWNSIVSLGYPQLAESQTGALSPLYVALYGLLDVNTAYNAVHLLHYVAAYFFTWQLARRFGLQAVGAHLAAVSFVYGWFPPRACLEWAIIGGAYCPLIVWAVESFLQTAQARWLAVIALALASFLLTGHFNLAFNTLLLSAGLVATRLVWATDGVAPQVSSARGRAALKTFAAVVLGFLIAAPQLVPTVELKLLSQREGGGFNQSYGHIPLFYLTQPFWPTRWYSPEIDPDQVLPNSNRIEAHLYFGAVPFYLAFAALIWRPERRDRRLVFMALAGVTGVVLATGVLMPVLRHVPGFGYFAGPGRYGMLTALAVALIGGRVFDRVLSVFLRRVWILAAAVVLTVTVVELSYVHDCVTYLTFLDRPPITLRTESPIAATLREVQMPVRVFAPGPNLPSMMGVNCVPEYLGIGPRQYYDKQLAIPRFSAEHETPELRESLIRWLQQAGVTHILSQTPLDETAWPVANRRDFLDPFLNASWGRGREPLFLYELKNSRPRAFLASRPDGRGVSIVDHQPERIRLDVDSAEATDVVLLELPFPGWRVTVDGERAEADVFEGQFRSARVPAGRHTVEWVYAPTSFRAGVAIGLVAIILLVFWMRRERRSVQSKEIQHE